jgi:DNA polymerase V
MTQHPQLEMQFSRWLPDVYGWCLPDIKPKWWQQLRALNPLVLPVYSGRVSAGFPSPADDYAESRLDLNEKLILNPNATFLVKCDTEAMIDLGIFSEDLLIVDRSRQAKNGDVVIAAVDGQLVIRRLHQSSQGIALVPENREFSVIPITEASDFMVWGVVQSTIHSF